MSKTCAASDPTLITAPLDCGPKETTGEGGGFGGGGFGLFAGWVAGVRRNLLRPRLTNWQKTKIRQDVIEGWEERNLQQFRARQLVCQ